MAHVHDSPTAAENYFNETIFGRLYTLMAEALATQRVAAGGASRGDRPSTADRTLAPRDGLSVADSSPRSTSNAMDAGRRTPVRRSGASDRRSLADRLDGWFWRRAQKEREAYLAGSVDVFDLERRIAALQRGVRGS